eukprot:566450-Alexandrium_andersonii.AAC.1
MEELNLEIASRTKPEPEMAMETTSPAQLEMDTPPAQPEMSLEITPPVPLERPLDLSLIHI